MTGNSEQNHLGHSHGWPTIKTFPLLIFLPRYIMQDKIESIAEKQNKANKTTTGLWMTCKYGISDKNSLLRFR